MLPLLLLLLGVSLMSGARGRNDGPGLDTGYTYKQVCLDNDKPVILDGFDCRTQIAAGRWRNAVNATGWTMFEVETKSNVPAEVQAYAAGFLEGILSKTVISYHITNMRSDYCTNFTGYCNRLETFLTENNKWIELQLKEAPRDDVYWQAVNRTYYQLSGLIDGYEGRDFAPRITYELHQITYLNMYGDFYDLEKKLNKTRDPAEMSDGHCSGLIKVAPGNKDLFISQVAMAGFQSMLRVLKLYKFAYDPEFYPGYGTTMASYPGILYSSDDFALLTSGLAVIETTITVFNTKLFTNTKPQGQLLTWLRAIVSNQLARNGREWCEIYSRYNSGTYNNQWIALDYNAFTPNKPLPDFGLLYVLEQMPGKVVYRDMTWFLQKYSYFPSYNVPYFKAIADYSGGSEKRGKMANWFIWGEAPRAKIFDREHSKVVDLDSLTTLMRYNDYKNEPFSRCNCSPPYTAEAAISARGDLNPGNGTYEFGFMGHRNHGGLDFKGTNLAMARKLQFRSWGGPTWTNVPAFKWSTCDFPVKHVGHPDEWKFQWIEHKWETEVAMRKTK